MSCKLETIALTLVTTNDDATETKEVITAYVIQSSEQLAAFLDPNRITASIKQK